MQVRSARAFNSNKAHTTIQSSSRNQLGVNSSSSAYRQGMDEYRMRLIRGDYNMSQEDSLHNQPLYDRSIPVTNQHTRPVKQVKLRA